MAVRPPSKDELAAIARGYGMHLSEEDLGSFEPMVAGLLSSYDAVEELYAQTAPRPPAGRAWKRPEPAENPLGAWYVKTEIQDKPDGPLARGAARWDTSPPMAWSRTPGRSRSSSPSTIWVRSRARWPTPR
jgi:hypothetical protein